ncbi:MULTISPECIES: TonB-dependent receptor [Sphingobium]|jgi:TonB-dependent receptor|uniref:TonB-dependent receptor n=2 Tax=Bacteria TaxID=2 RepID=A0A0J9D651_SPHYA|nr:MULTISPECIES: TonB-dependent receptor [Sphingobium]ATP16972.1 TonB-dependent receptor [Sphingobium yanoikuyae]KMW32987.1 TonB-dependent receptor [Sphingobium yanoikuyae]TKV41576.1 TonB-dependent receptor [Sphingobium sp. MP9-4]
MKTLFRGASRAAIILATAMPVAALAGTISGTVSDGTGTRALQSTQLRIVENGRIAEAGRDGSYRFPDVAPGTYTIEARYTGADPVRTTVVVPATGDVDADIRIGSNVDASIIVVGQVANQASALSRQRAADGVESVLTRDAIGQFPDQNVAESLRRLPGVNIMNDQGEGRFVSVRGLDPELNAASVNGARLPAPESDVRSVALDVVPSELIESIEVKKSLTPDMDADTIGASIEINTTSAFDRKKDLYSVKLEGSYNDYADTATPKGSVDFATRLSDNFGISGGFSYYKRQFETDNIETGGWKTAENGVVYTDEPEYRDYDVTRKRIGATLNMDWRPSDTTKLYARGIYNQFDDHEYRRRLAFVFDEEPASGDADSANFTDEDGRIEVRRDLKDRFERQRIKSLVLGGTTETGPWKLTYSGSWSESTEKEKGSIDPIRWRARFDGDGVDVGFNYSDPRVPTFEVTSGNDLFTDPSEYGFNRVEQTALSDSRDREYALKGDISRAFAMDGGTFTVQAGMKARFRKKSYNFNMNYYGDGDLSLADVLGDSTYRLIGIDPVPGKGQATDYFYNNIGEFELDPIASAYESATADYSAKEDILATYMMGRWDSATVRLIGGVRMEQTRNVLRGSRTEYLLDEEEEITGVSVTPNVFTKNYTNWLPSLTARFEPSQGLVFRAAGYKSLVRPKLSQMAPRFYVDEDGGATFGNPDLKPFLAWNLDASAEWYFSSNGALTAGVFWKSIKDYSVTLHDFDGGVYQGIPYNEATIYQNGDTAKVKGVELSFSQVLNFLPAPLDGFLVNLNYTYTDASGKITSYDDDDNAYLRGISLPNASKHTLNAVLGYEKGPISFRAAGTYRSKYLDEIGDAADSDRYVDNHFQLDLSAKYKILPGVRLFADWVNVNNAKYFAYQNFEGSKRLLQYEEYNWTAKFGISASF